MYAHVSSHMASSGGGGGAYSPRTSFNLVANGSHNMAAGFLHSIIVKNAVGLATLHIGLTPGGREIADSLVVAAGVAETVTQEQEFTAAQTIYFTGITSSTDIIIIKH